MTSDYVPRVNWLEGRAPRTGKLSVLLEQENSWTKRSASTAITPPREYGSLSVLETDRKRLEGLIEQGYNDAVHHDCKTNRCVLPTDP